MTQQQIADEVGVSRQTVSTWKRDGVDLSDIEALKRRAATIPNRRGRPVPFGRKLREVLEDMPLALIDEIDAATDRRGKFAPLVRWVGDKLRELGMHDDRPEGLLLTPEEAEAVRQYREEIKREEAGR